MSRPSSFIVIGFGPPGQMTQHSIEQAKARGLPVRYIQLPVAFADLTVPSPAMWQSIKDIIKDDNESIIIWASNALIIWDAAERAFAVNHEPDFLWPLSLSMENEALKIQDSLLYKAVGAFEISLFDFMDLERFHNAVRARALYKLLSVCNIETFTLGEYVAKSWDSFECVKAPDIWIIAGDDELKLEPQRAHFTKYFDTFKAHHSTHNNMAREALDAKSRNTIFASDFARSNLDLMRDRMNIMMQTMPYYGFWPMNNYAQPVHGHHPAVFSKIWQGEYKRVEMKAWEFLLRWNAYKKVIDCCDDGHVFGLTFMAHNDMHSAIFYSLNTEAASWAMSAAQTNGFDNRIDIHIKQTPQPDADAMAIMTPDKIHASLWGAMNVFIPLGGMMRIEREIPKGYIAVAMHEKDASMEELGTLNDLGNYSAVILLSQDKISQRKIAL